MVNRREYNREEKAKLEEILDLEQEQRTLQARGQWHSRDQEDHERYFGISKIIRELNPLRAKDYDPHDTWPNSEKYSEDKDGLGYDRCLPMSSEESKLVNLVESHIPFGNFLQIRVQRLREKVNYVLFFEVDESIRSTLPEKMEDKYRKTNYSDELATELGLDNIDSIIPNGMSAKYKFKELELSPNITYGGQGGPPFEPHYGILAIELSFEDHALRLGQLRDDVREKETAYNDAIEAMQNYKATMITND